jgi:hypothetical protein
MRLREGTRTAEEHPLFKPGDLIECQDPPTESGRFFLANVTECAASLAYPETFVWRAAA